MKRCSGTGKEALYWLVCDNCENFTEQYDDEWELLREASEKGWRWMGEKCFCGHACMSEYLQGKGGEQ